jgi:hypothetical protein
MSTPSSFPNYSRSLAALLPILLLALLACLPESRAGGDPGRIYTVPDPAAKGGIEGHSPVPVTHAFAVDHERVHVYRGKLSDGGKAFRFDNLPVGKYDIVLVDEGKIIWEGATLGEALPPPGEKSAANLAQRISLAEAFFNRHIVHRLGLSGDHCYAFVERLRDLDALTQVAGAIGNVSRLEIIELQQAGDDWQMTDTRHLYREEEPKKPGAPFMRHYYVSDLGNIRVIDTVKKLPDLSFPQS